ncbi:hypothetical protein BDK51DRAFT_29511 [Blyttiomyces helicus]|uniref:Uncharacterized protein n=1 Tax=Blyttiomyces helicus TaxID=388810 RepID=A0A4P9WNZ9_9FUNG|nr:hypothetical protein BDK51DRAFT_29511 [Blyttiomyces helicus]|eukprot:RKO94734.1 hypothetical protein BDK51DRAFT_29511 [Blyttiomyces helicus]
MFAHVRQTDARYIRNVDPALVQEKAILDGLVCEVLVPNIWGGSINFSVIVMCEGSATHASWAKIDVTGNEVVGALNLDVGEDDAMKGLNPDGMLLEPDQQLMVGTDNDLPRSEHVRAAILDKLDEGKAFLFPYREGYEPWPASSSFHRRGRGKGAHPSPREGYQLEWDAGLGLAG